VTNDSGIDHADADETPTPTPGSADRQISPAGTEGLGRQEIARRPLREAAVLIGATLGAVAAFLTITNPNVGIGLTWTLLILCGVVLAAAIYLWRRSVTLQHRRIALAAGLAAVLAMAICIGAVVGQQRPSPPMRPFQGDIRFEFPSFGNTLASGQDVYGTVTEWSPGFQVWLFVRLEGSAVETPSGPCLIRGDKWNCTNVNLPGRSGDHEYLTVLVAPAAETADYPTRTTLPPVAVRDETQAYKG
jgi:uncharacterized membrane protein